MNIRNQSRPIFFIVKGISDEPVLQVPIFILFLVIYIITLSFNLSILSLVCLESHLHTPMYFFLANLALMDVTLTTTTLYKALIGFLLRDKTMSFVGCITQFYFFASVTGGELFILTVMSFDRYVAICNPLHYRMIMNCRVCVLLAVTCWFLALMEVVPIVVILSDFTCYFSTEINHFFCDVIPLIKLICSDTSRLDLTVFVIAAFLSTLPSVLTFTPYIFIIITILRINSSTGRRKAFHTCSSHLTVVIMFYVTLICQYLRPASSENVQANKLIALFNTSAAPVLNPLIYSLNNKDVKTALRHRLKKCKMVV